MAKTRNESEVVQVSRVKVKDFAIHSSGTNRTYKVSPWQHWGGRVIEVIHLQIASRQVGQAVIEIESKVPITYHRATGTSFQVQIN
jgi:hypothetical protein